MPATTLLEALYAKLDAGMAVPVSSELRRQGDATPAVVYEVTSMVPFLHADGLNINAGTLSVRMDCVADSAATAWTTALGVMAVVDGTWTQSGWKFQLTGAEFAQTRAAPDDGQADAERICTLTAVFQFTEDQ
jgi:hypothetical protein